MSSTSSTRSRSTVARVTSIAAMVSTTMLLFAGGLGVLVPFARVSTASAADTAVVRVGAYAEQAPDGVTPVRQRRIAVNHATGDVYVADQANDRVSVYRQNGTGADPLTSFGTGDLSDPYGVAIDQDSGSVYVSDLGGVSKYDSDGATTPAFTKNVMFAAIGATGPLAYDQAGDALLLADTTANVVRRYQPNGMPLSTFDGTGSPAVFTGLQDIAVDSTGDVIVIDAEAGTDPGTGGTTRIERFDAGGAWEATIGPVDQAATVGVIPAGDEVLIGGNQDAVNQDELPTLSRFAADGTALGPVAVDGSAAFSTISGIAADDGGNARVSVATDVSAGSYAGQYGLTSVQTYVVAAPPAFAGVSVGGITTTAVTFEATINPGGLATSYRVELSADAGATWVAVDPDHDGDEDAGNGAAAVPVQADITGLDPARTYTVRLLATSLAGTATSAMVSFDTDDAAPSVRALSAAGVQPDGARMRGRVNPNAKQTTYWFEYGPTDAYGASAPAGRDAIAGSGRSFVDVSRLVHGLAPGTYHYRLVAQNSVGASTGPDRTFTTTASDGCSNVAIRATQGTTRLPDCRAYEMVSPADQSGGGVNYPSACCGQSAAVGGLDKVSEDGEVTSFWGFQPFGEVRSGLETSQRATRTASGWVARQWSPDPARTRVAPHHAERNLINLATPDLALGFMPAVMPYDPLVQRPKVADAGDLPGVFDVYAVSADRTTDWVTRPVPEGPATDDVDHKVVGFSRDGQTVAYERLRYNPPFVPKELFLRRGGQSVRADAEPGQAPVSSCGAAISTGQEKNNLADRTALSGDGRRLFFTAPDPHGFESSADPACQEAPQVYMRDGDVIRVVSASQRTVADAPARAFFEGASADGATVLIRSDAALTDDATPGGSGYLYRYDVASQDLTLMNPGGGSQGVVAQGRDAAYVYFVEGVYVRVYHAGQVKTVGKLDTNPVGNDNTELAYWTVGQPPLDVTPDGKWLAFISYSDLGDFRADRLAEIYRYSASDESVICVSCNEAGTKPIGNASIGRADTNTTIGSLGRPRNITPDGSRLVFETPDALVPEDANGNDDVYQWHDGKVDLISDGETAGGSHLFDTSVDMTSIFFTTTASLLPQEIANGSNDVYVARTGGGFPEPDKQRACAGDECQGPIVATTEPRPGAASAIPRSDGGDAAPAIARPRARIATSSRASLKRLATAGSATVTVTVTTPGTITVTGRSVIGKRTIRVAVATRRVTKAGAYRLPVSLTAVARRELEQRKKLRTTFSVAFTGQRLSPKLTIDLVTKDR